MPNSKRRFMLIFISIGLGTALSAFLLMIRKGTLKTEDYASLFVNMLFALAIIIVIGILLKKKKNL